MWRSSPRRPRAERNVRKLDPTGVARVIAEDAVDTARQFKDFDEYRLDAVAEAPKIVKDHAELVRRKEGITIRQWDMGHFEHEMELFREVYNSAWEQNWGMVKLSDNELKAHTLEMKNLVWPDLAFFAFQGGKVMAASLTLPNYNEVIIKMNGRLFPFGALRILSARLRKNLKSCRVFALGVKQEFRRSGVGAVFYYDTLMAAKRLGFTWGETQYLISSVPLGGYVKMAGDEPAEEVLPEDRGRILLRRSAWDGIGWGLCTGSSLAIAFPRLVTRTSPSVATN